MTSPTGDDDQYWRRPDPGDPPTGGTSPATPGGQEPPRYTGPPRTTPPPPGWQPPFVVQPAPPRELPAQDHEAIDQQERSARTVTYGIGMIAGAIMLLLLCLFCSRLLF